MPEFCSMPVLLAYNSAYSYAGVEAAAPSLATFLQNAAAMYLAPQSLLYVRVLL